MSSSDLDRLAHDYWEHHLVTHPTEAHLLGRYEHAALVEDGSRQAEDRIIGELQGFAARAREIDPASLDYQERTTREVLLVAATSEAEVRATRLAEIGVDPINGRQVEFPLLLGTLSVPDADVADAVVAKLGALAVAYDQDVARLRDGLASGRVPAAFAVSGTVEQVDAILAAPLAEDPHLVRLPATPDGVDREAWHARAVAVVEGDLRPAMARYRDFLRDELLTHTRSDDACGLGALPDGATTYAALLRHYTTTDLTAEEIHAMGLAQVASLAQEYRALGPEVVGTDDLARIFDALRTDPALHFETGDQLVEASEKAVARSWAAMPEWFEVLPQSPCLVEATASGPKAFYFQPSADGTRGGTFFINTSDPTSWGLFELEAVAFHEALPGHHLQLAIASELTGIPEFRKHLILSAYAEGWGLYTERLSDEMGLYSAAIDRMGMYAMDSLRACRLVVDTGLHALGWSREQAVQYMLANSPLSEGVVRPEVDRYAVLPGQACSYMVGRLEVERIRREAEQRQGDAFDIRAFHSAVLDSGMLPLGVLDEVVRRRLP